MDEYFEDLATEEGISDLGELLPNQELETGEIVEFLQTLQTFESFVQQKSVGNFMSLEQYQKLTKRKGDAAVTKGYEKAFRTLETLSKVDLICLSQLTAKLKDSVRDPVTGSYFLCLNIACNNEFELRSTFREGLGNYWDSDFVDTIFNSVKQKLELRKVKPKFLQERTPLIYQKITTYLKAVSNRYEIIVALARSYEELYLMEERRKSTQERSKVVANSMKPVGIVKSNRQNLAHAVA